MCLWRRSLCSNLASIDPEKLYRAIFICQYGLCCCIGPHFCSTVLGSLQKFFGQMVYRPTCQKIARTPMVKNLFFARKILFRTLRKLITFRNARSVRFQANCKYSEHARAKLIKANKYLFVLRSLLKEGFQSRWPNFTYGLSVYGAVDAELTVIQNFLDRYFKRKYTSKRKDIRELLKRQMRSFSRYVQWIPIARFVTLFSEEERKKVST